MPIEKKDINNEEMFKMLTEVSKQNSDSIIKLNEGQTSIVDSIKSLNETIIKGVGASDNNNPTGAGIGMELSPKVTNPKDVGAKVIIPNVTAPGEYGSEGRSKESPQGDKGGLRMEAKSAKDLKKAEDLLKVEELKKSELLKATELANAETLAKAEELLKVETLSKAKELVKLEETRKADEEKKKKDEIKKMDEEAKTKKEKDEKANKYKSYNYTDNEPLRPTIMTKSFETYPDGYQIIKATLEDGWGIEGADAGTVQEELFKRLNNGEFGHFAPDITGGSF